MNGDMECDRTGSSGPVILAVQVQPQRLGWLLRELEAAGLPYEVQRAGTAYHVYTSEAARPVAEKVVNYTPQQQWARRGGLDLLSRQPQNRSRGMDAAGFVLALLVVAVIVTQAGAFLPLVAGLGLAGDMGRGVLVLVSGLAVTLGISELVIGPDPRRWLFVLGMMGLFGTAAVWFIAKGMGVL